MNQDVVLTVKTGTNPALPSQQDYGLVQSAPYPQVLAYLVGRSTYKPGWHVSLADIDRGQGSKGLTLTITSSTEDSRVPGTKIRVAHLFPVPPANYNERSWQRWLFDRYLEVEAHECAEFFRIDGRLPYAPLHAPGNDPYMVVEATVTEEHTDNQGNVTADPRAPIDTLGTRPRGWGE